MSGPVIVSALFRHPVKGMAGLPLEEAVLTETGIAGDRTWLVVREDGRFLTQRQCPRLALLRPEPATGGLRLNAGAAAPGRPALSVREPPWTRSGADREPDPARASARTEACAPARLRVRVWRDELDALDAGDEAAAWLSEVLRMPGLRLVRAIPGNDGLRRNEPRFGAGAAVHFADAAPLLVTSTSSLDVLNAELRSRGRTPVPMDRFRPNVVLRGLEAFREHGALRLRGPGWVLRLVDPCERCVVPTIDQQTGEKDPDFEPWRTLVEVDPMPGAPGRPAFGQNAVVEAGERPRIRVGDPVDVLP